MFYLSTIAGTNDEDHFRNLEMVFQKLLDAGLTLNEKKCVFFKIEVSLLGHIISKNGLTKSEEHISAIVDAEAPETVMQVKSFAGLVNYYGKYVPHLSQIMCPIYNLTRQGVEFNWTKECQDAFDKIKK